MGFTFDDDAAQKGETEPLATMDELVRSKRQNQSRILPYIGGEEVNSDPLHKPHRFAIDFGDMPLRRSDKLPKWRGASEKQRVEWLRTGIVPSDFSDPVASDWPELLSIVEKWVKPKRLKDKREIYRRLWWRYGERRAALYPTIAELAYVLAVSRVSPQYGIARLPSAMIFADSVDVFAFSNFAPFATIQARIHEHWARFLSSSMKDDLRYTPSDCFETFPFPSHFEISAGLEAVGRAYHEHRAALMVARNEGMTKTYNRFHDPTETAEDIKRLRELHAAMDRAVLEAYSWDDLAVRAAPLFLDVTNEDDHTYQGRLFWPSDFRDKVLARLLALNAERHADEVRLGIAPAVKEKEEADGDDVGDDDNPLKLLV
jgi:restriction-modification enzyme MmeI-like protein